MEDARGRGAIDDRRRAEHRCRSVDQGGRQQVWDEVGSWIYRALARFLPSSFCGVLPPSPLLARASVRLPPAWWLLGKQLIVIGRAGR